MYRSVCYVFLVLVVALGVYVSLSNGEEIERGYSPTRYSVFFPKTEDKELLSFFSDPNVFWYTEDEMPKVFQHDLGTPGRAHFISVYRDIGPNGPRYSNGNGEWPWAHPAIPVNDGRVRNVIGARITGVQVFQQPLQHWSLVTGSGYYRTEPRETILGTNWKFSPGTEFVELVTNRIGDGDYTFKVHRMTMGGDGQWFFRVYRPFTSRQEYEAATKTVARNHGSHTMVNPHLVKVFKESRELWKVPPISPELAKNLLLSTSFKLAEDDEFIPTTDHYDQIYPKGYLGAFIGNGKNQENCRNCHKDVQTEVRKFDNGEWYGHIRGGGHDSNGVGVFSWYPK